jgi:hypothetical protein
VTERGDPEGARLCGLVGGLAVTTTFIPKSVQQDHVLSMTEKVDSSQSQATQDEIADLERRLRDAKARLNGSATLQTTPSPSKVLNSGGTKKQILSC